MSALFEGMRARGQDPASLASRSGVIEEVASLGAVADEAAPLLAEPDLGIRLAATTAGPLGPGEVPAEGAPTPTLGDALARLAALSGRGDPRARFTFELAETGGVL